MHSAIRPARLNDKFQDPLYLFLELVRAGVMHGHLWSGRAFSGGPSFGTGTVVRPLGVFPRPSEVIADGEACVDRRRKVMHVIGHADAQYSSAKLQGMCTVLLQRTKG